MADLWSSIRDNALESIGLDRDTRDQLQPYVDQAAALGRAPEQTDGYRPPFMQANAGSTVPTGNVGFFNKQVFGIPAWIFVVITAALLALLIKRK